MSAEVPRSQEPELIKLTAEALPGEPLFDHPADVAPTERTRIWEVLQVIMPSGELELYGVPGEWGAPYREQQFAGARERTLLRLAAEAGESPHAFTLLGRECRLETLR